MVGSEPFDFLQDLLVFDVSVTGDEVHVALYGGRTPMCGSVRFTFPSASERERTVTVLEAWKHDVTPVSLIARGENIRIFREDLLFERALAADER